MHGYIALLRAVNAVGTGTLVKADLRGLCEAIGFAEMRTRNASGKRSFAVPRLRCKRRLHQTMRWQSMPASRWLCW